MTDSIYSLEERCRVLRREGEGMQGKYGLLTALVAVGVLTFAVASASAAPKPQTIRLLEVDTSFTGTGGFPTTSNGAPPAVGQGFTAEDLAGG
jgi:hypothetical protein